MFYGLEGCDITLLPGRQDQRAFAATVIGFGAMIKKRG